MCRSVDVATGLCLIFGLGLRLGLARDRVKRRI